MSWFNMSATEYGILVVVMLAIYMGIAEGSCIKHRVCDDPNDILHSIKGYPDNYQQLLNAFHPINRAKPSSVIIAYFTNYIDPLPEECSLGTYPWKMYPTINNSYQSIAYQMWTTTAIYAIASEMLMIEFAEYLPTVSYYFIFNKTSPFMLETPIACIKVPFYLRDDESGDNYVILGTVTRKVSILYITVVSEIFAGRNFRESLDLGLFAFLFSRMATCFLIFV